MSLRTIMIFPEFDNINIIDEIREKYDPLAELVRPHMTVGKLDDAKQLNDAFNSVKDNEAVFKSRITKISVEMIGENEESIIIIEKQLC